MTFAVVTLGGLSVIGGVIIAGRFMTYLAWRAGLVRYRMTLPAGIAAEDVAGWLASLAALTHAPRGALLPSPPVVIETTATNAGVRHDVVVPKNMAGAVLASVRAALPAARLTETEPVSAMSSAAVAAASVALRGRRRQLAIERAQALSLSQLAALQPLRAGELIRWQWIITSAGTPEPVRTGEARASGLPWWLEGQAPADADEMRSARLKQREPLLHVAGRVVVQARTRTRVWELFGRVWGPIRLLNTPGARLVRTWGLPSRAVAWLSSRYYWPLTRWPLLLNSAELAGLLAFPMGERVLPGVPTPLTRQVPPPHDLAMTGTVLADSRYPGFDRPLTISRTDRLMHCALLGPTGTGKSTLMINMALQDAGAGDGLAVLDPKSDMVADLLPRLPLSRRGDVILINPADTDRPVGFNVLATDGSEAARELAVDHVLHVFHEQWKEFWGPRTDAVLRAGLLVLTATRAADGSAFTVCELPGLLTNTAFRRFVLSQTSVPPAVHDFFAWFEALKAGEQAQVVGPVLNKLTALTQRTPLRLLLGQSDGLDLAAVMRERKLLLMPLSRGLVGAETAQLLSSLMLASLWQATLGRVQVPKPERRPFWLFVDEAAEVVRLPLELGDLMSEARGLGLGLTLATQYLAQLPTPTRKALLATVRSQVVFQVEQDDARLLSRAFEPSLSADDLRSLPAYEVALRLCIAGQTSRPMTGTTRPLPDELGDSAEVRRMSRQRYGRDRRAVEAGLRDRLTVPTAARPTIGQRRAPRGGNQ